MSESDVDYFRGGISLNMDQLSKIVNASLPFFILFFFLLGHFVSFFFHFLTVAFTLLTVANFHYRHVQKRHTLLANFGVLAQARYMFESIGPEFRQYLFMSDTEEKPFNRVERTEVYRKSKGIDSSSAYGSLKLFDKNEIKLRHSLYPEEADELAPYALTFGEERNIKNTYTIYKPIIISGMSYGALGRKAVRALARGAKKAGVLMNTGEGGHPKHHLLEGCDLIFQMGTAKFGVRNHDSSLNDDLLRDLSARKEIKMIEIKFSQGAKPGKGGLLPKEKISKEISELRGVPMGEDVVSPPFHVECRNPESTVDFIRRVQEVSQLPVGIKLCFGRSAEFRNLIQCMKKKDIFPDYISIDGAEGGTGAAPKSFMDDLGVPIFKALPLVNNILRVEEVRDRVKLLAAGKLLNPGRQFMAFAMGADAIYTARGFMLSVGCIQALQCNKNICPVGITTHDEHLQKGLDIEEKSDRVVSYVDSLMHEKQEILASLGKGSLRQLTTEDLFQEGIYYE